MLADALLVEGVAGRADHPEGPDARARSPRRALAAGRRAGRRTPCRLGSPTQRLPVVDMIETSERTRSGCSIAIVWTIIPPIEAPTRWADSIPRWSISPNVSRGHVAQQVGRGARGGRRACRRGSAPRPTSILVERPMSRLSKRMTRKPRSASSAQKLLVPGDHLRRQAHHQEQRLAVGVAHLLVGRARSRWRGRSARRRRHASGTV